MAKLSLWQRDQRERDRRRDTEAKAARLARGARVFAVLPWQGDGRYDGANALAWFKTEKAAERYALEFRGLGGAGLVVREWTYAEIESALRRAGYR